MGLDFHGYFSLGAAYRGPEWLLGEFAGEPPAIRECVVRFGHLWSVKEWHLKSPTDLLGPGGFWFTIGERAVQVYHCVKFAEIGWDPEHRARMRAACFAIANLVGSPRAIYMHELMPGGGVDDGANLDDIESKVRATIGPPAANFDELAEAKDFGPRRWYIDDFADLRATR